MSDKTIAELQQELDKLGIEPVSPQEDNSLDASLEDDDNLSQDEDLNKTVKTEEESKDETKVKDEKPQAKVSSEFLQKKAEERSIRRQNRITQVEQKLGSFEATLNEIKSLIVKGKPEQAEDKITTYAQKHNLDAEGIKELVNIIGEKFSDKTKTEEKPVEEDAFNDEWGLLLPKLEAQYPNANASQIKEAQKLLDEIAHSSPQLATYDLEDIINSPKYNQKFKDILFSAKKKTFEAGRTVERGKLEEDIDFDNLSIDSPAKALKAKEALYKATGGHGAKMFESGSGNGMDV